MSVVINWKNLTKERHNFYIEIIKELNITRNFYFVKSSKSNPDENINELTENNIVKIILSNFPDSIYLPLVISLYGNSNPKLVLFIEAEDLSIDCKNELLQWINSAYSKINKMNYDYIFGNSQIINGNKIGCSLLLSKSSTIVHLLYHTDSDTTHANPFLQLSLATQTKFDFIQFNSFNNVSKLENINCKLSKDFICPMINDNLTPSLGIMIPAYKRNYFSFSFSSFSKQTYKPKFYIIIQNDNLKHFNLSYIQSIVDEPVYHIWMKNWNSFFYLSHRISALLPCDFILKYDDDQWPNEDKLQEILINKAINQNIIIGNNGYFVQRSICGYSPKYFNKSSLDNKDHVAVPLLIRPSYLKLDSRNKLFRIYGSEDVSLSINAYNLCNVLSKTLKMNLTEKQIDGNSQGKDKKVILAKKKEKIFNFFISSYCFLIRSGYIPKRWIGFKLPIADYINITIKHKKLF